MKIKVEIVTDELNTIELNTISTKYIDEAYDNYRTKAKLSQILTDLTKEEFVELCKNDITFSVYWGLKKEGKI